MHVNERRRSAHDNAIHIQAGARLMTDDLKLQQRVLDELAFTPDVDAAHIGVAARAGVVTLSGHVSSVHEKLIAEEAVRRVKGVKAVAQELEVRPAADKKLADDEIAARAVRLLDWDLSLPPGAVTVTVSHGVVTLSGEVEWHFQRREAEADVRKLGGVTGVINNIRLQPEARAGEVRDAIHAALERAAGLDAESISVTMQRGGLVVLRGHVRTLGAQVAAENAAWSAPGVTAVENHIEVRPHTPSAL